ncbi:MAG: polysaccharide biosynthesis C-terminal domain-containing protein [Aerococcus sp.]|nr:polysaccharide biosynthesis C-terminal domain-containing protein [Aerococcus sp.]
MNSVKKLKLNTLASFINQILTIVSGLILPRLILSYFGSDTNGLVSSINQFLSIITFLDLGVGSVVQASLYKPLAEKDEGQVNLVLSSARNFFNNIARILSVYVFVLIIIFPTLIDSSLDFFSTGFLILALSLNLLGQFYFGIVNQLLLSADQRDYVQLFSQSATVVLNLLLSIVLIMLGCSIQWVKLGSGLVYIMRPLFLAYYVKRHYNVKMDVPVTEEPIKQKWNAMAQHIAYTVTNSTDVVVVSVFSTFENVSVYAIYNMVISALRMLIDAANQGLKSFFGTLIAREESTLLNEYFNRIEWLIHMVAVFLFGMTQVLILSFVMIYTSGVHDANYYVPAFATVFILSQLMYSIRVPYHTMIMAAGHFKQTQTSSLIEAGLNVMISIILVQSIGLLGVAIGTLIAIVYRMFYLVWYLSKNILKRPVNMFVKQLIVDSLLFSSFVFLVHFIPLNQSNFFWWAISAVIYGMIFVVGLVIINYIFYHDNMHFVFGYFSRLLKRR